MFPFTFPALMFAWTFLFFFSQDTLQYQNIANTAVALDIVLVIVFLILAVRFYNRKIRSVTAKAFATALNLSVIPLTLVNLSVLPVFFTMSGSAVLAYVLPVTYFPIIFTVAFALAYAYFNRQEKKARRRRRSSRHPSAPVSAGVTEIQKSYTPKKPAS